MKFGQLLKTKEDLISGSKSKPAYDTYILYCTVFTFRWTYTIFSLFSFNMNPFGDRLTFWSCTIGMFMAAFGTAMSQTTVQRFCALKTERDAKM